jgi:hypothetical protein
MIPWRTSIASFGAEMSPSTLKAHCYFRSKAILHQWILRKAEKARCLAAPRA